MLRMSNILQKTWQNIACKHAFAKVPSKGSLSRKKRCTASCLLSPQRKSTNPCKQRTSGSSGHRVLLKSTSNKLLTFAKIRLSIIGTSLKPKLLWKICRVPLCPTGPVHLERANPDLPFRSGQDDHIRFPKAAWIDLPWQHDTLLRVARYLAMDFFDNDSKKTLKISHGKAGRYRFEKNIPKIAFGWHEIYWNSFVFNCSYVWFLWFLHHAWTGTLHLLRLQIDSGSLETPVSINTGKMTTMPVQVTVDHLITM